MPRGIAVAKSWCERLLNWSMFCSVMHFRWNLLILMWSKLGLKYLCMWRECIRVVQRHCCVYICLQESVGKPWIFNRRRALRKDKYEGLRFKYFFPFNSLLLAARLFILFLRTFSVILWLKIMFNAHILSLHIHILIMTCLRYFTWNVQYLNSPVFTTIVYRIVTL